MANTPQFVASANLGAVRTTAANAASDGSGTLGTDIYTLVTAGANGTRVDRISIINSQATAAASTALVVRIFFYDGTISRLIAEIALPTATRSASAVGAKASEYFPGGLLLKSGQSLRCCASVFAAASQCDIVAYGGDM